MKLRSITTTVGLALCQLAWMAHADPTTDEAAKSLEIAKVVPKLNIVWNCSGCTQNEKVIPLIEQAYGNEVAKHGKVISETESVDVTIVSYRQRNPGNRVMFGMMAGKDILGLTIKYNGNELSVSDYSANTIQGMDYLCQSVAKRTYNRITGQDTGATDHAEKQPAHWRKQVK